MESSYFIAMKKPGRLETGRLKTACPNISDVIAFECSNPIECRINSCLRKVKTTHLDVEHVSKAIIKNERVDLQ